MKRFLSLFVILIAFSSCEEDIKLNTPGFQVVRNDVLWQANDARAYVSPSGNLTVEGLTQFEQVTLGTSSTNVGKYSLGTSNQSNFAAYTLTIDETTYEFATIPVPGQVSGTTIVSGGTGYSSDCTYNSTSGSYTCTEIRETTGGSGSGLMVSVGTNSSGAVNYIRVVAPGNGYMPGDLITVTGGNLNCKFRVLNVRNSNGEIEITEYDSAKMTISGKFKFNAVNVNSPLSGQVFNFQYGEFYKVPIFPEP